MHSQPLSGQSAALVHWRVQKPCSLPSLPVNLRHLPSTHSSPLVQSSPSFLLPDVPELPDEDEEDVEPDDEELDDELDEVLLQSSAWSSTLIGLDSPSPDDDDAPDEEPPDDEPPDDDEEPDAPDEEPPDEEPDAPDDDAPEDEPPDDDPLDDDVAGHPLPDDDELDELDPQATAKAMRENETAATSLMRAGSLKRRALVPRAA